MMQSFRRYLELPRDDRSLVLEASCILVIVRIGLWTLPFLTLRRALDSGARIFTRTRTSANPYEPARVAWSVSAAARRLPPGSTCLIESLAVDAMLRRRGVPSQIRIGARPPGGKALAAHAWVEHAGEVVFGARADLSEFAVLLPRDAQ